MEESTDGELVMEVLSSGPMTSVQDGGRVGFLGRGIPPAGAQDHHALALANVIVGNQHSVPLLCQGDPGDAGLEFTIVGPKIRFSGEVVVAVTGATFAPKIDGEPFPMWQSVTVPAGALLDIGQASKGARGYLAIAGGINVPRHLGSRSTYVRGGMGGHEGRVLRKGDRLPLGTPRHPLREVTDWKLEEGAIPLYGAPMELRVILGAQDHLFEPESVVEFLSQEWTMTPVADRMGFRIKGHDLKYKPRSAEVVRDGGSEPSNVVDDVSPLGGIQCPASGEAIIMGVEVPSAGGYAKIATVISADIGRVGQLRPGDAMRFTSVSLDEALRIAEVQTGVLDSKHLVRAQA